jgi:hypothetical protein
MEILSPAKMAVGHLSHKPEEYLNEEAQEMSNHLLSFLPYRLAYVTKSDHPFRKLGLQAQV